MIIRAECLQNTQLLSSTVYFFTFCRITLNDVVDGNFPRLGFFRHRQGELQDAVFIGCFNTVGSKSASKSELTGERAVASFTGEPLNVLRIPKSARRAR